MAFLIMLLFIIVSNKSSKEDHFIGEWQSENLLLQGTYDENFELMTLIVKDNGTCVLFNEGEEVYSLKWEYKPSDSSAEIKEQYIYYELYLLYDHDYNIGIIAVRKDKETLSEELWLILGENGQPDLISQFVRK